jgi:uncharacterized membrane protein
MRARTPTRAGAFERGYSVVVALKGLDGFVELLAGLLLIGAPDLTGDLLLVIAAELGEGTSPLREAASRSITSAGTGLTGDALPLGAFLLVHGVVKLLTVWALLRRALRWYPWAIAAVAVLLGVQVAGLVPAPTAGGLTLVVLDVAVLVLVVAEFVRLRRERR